jgi:4-hydroxy-3-polyprenylbenzoate decarboxylase
MTGMDIVVAITGASGAIYAQRFIQGLVAAGVRTHLVVSPMGRRLLHDELGMETLYLPALAGTDQHSITRYDYRDLGARIASGSFLHDGMVVVPCSSNTLAQIAHGHSGNLVSRAAAVTLKERRRLVLCHREMPLSPMDVNNYKTLTDAGAIVAPASPGLYLNPTTVGEIADFVAGKLLDLVHVAHNLATRWQPAPRTGDR